MSRCRVWRAVTKDGIRARIWECSDGEMRVSGVWRSWAAEVKEEEDGKRRRFRTQIQIGIVLERASGMDLPRRVESTMIHL